MSLFSFAYIANTYSPVETQDPNAGWGMSDGGYGGGPRFGPGGYGGGPPRGYGGMNHYKLFMITTN